MSYQDIAHHYEDGPESPAPAQFERVSEHTARKTHRCDCCGGTIQPGQRYTTVVYKDSDVGFQTSKTHADGVACEAMRQEVEAWHRQQHQDADYSY